MKIHMEAVTLLSVLFATSSILATAADDTLQDRQLRPTSPVTGQETATCADVDITIPNQLKGELSVCSLPPFFLPNPQFSKYSYLNSNLPESSELSGFLRQFANTHLEEYLSVQYVSKGRTVPIEIPDSTGKSIEEDIDNLKVTLFDYSAQEGNKITEEKVKDIIAATSTDGLLIMHKGQVVYEKYFPKTGSSGDGIGTVKGYDKDTRHNLFSVSKSFIGLLVRLLEYEGVIGIDDPITKYLTALKSQTSNGAFKDATVKQLSDMTTEYQWSENEPSLPCDFQQLFKNIKKQTETCNLGTAFDRSCYPGILLDVPKGCEQTADFLANFQTASSPNFWRGWQFPENMGGVNLNPNIFEFPGAYGNRQSKMSLKPSDSEIQNGDRFKYRTANTDVLGWLLEEKTEYGVTEYLSKKIWSKLGVAFDAACHVDSTGLPYVGGGLTTTLKDLALFGEMIRNYGRNMKGEQIVPIEIITDIKNNGNITQFGSSYLALTCAIGGPAEFCSEFPKEARVNSYLRAIGKPDGLPGWAYKDQFWTIPDNIVTQIGIRGQYNWVDFNADIVITKFSSKPTESERSDDEYRAFLKIAEYFINKENKPTREPKKGKGNKKQKKVK